MRFHELPLLDRPRRALDDAVAANVADVVPLSGVVAVHRHDRVFYLPPVDLAGRFNLWYALRYLGFFFCATVAIASFEVAWLAVRPGPVPKTSIIAVRLHTTSDFILTIVGLTISLIPGSLVAEVDRFGSTLYLHVLNTPSQKAITKMRHDVCDDRAAPRILTLGSREEVKAVRR